MDAFSRLLTVKRVTCCVFGERAIIVILRYSENVHESPSSERLARGCFESPSNCSLEGLHVACCVLGEKGTTVIRRYSGNADVLSLLRTFKMVACCSFCLR